MPPRTNQWAGIKKRIEKNPCVSIMALMKSGKDKSNSAKLDQEAARPCEIILKPDEEKQEKHRLQTIVNGSRSIFKNASKRSAAHFVISDAPLPHR